MSRLFTSAFALSLVAIAPAVAQDAAPTRTVSYDDLNLTTVPGRAMLNRRISAAVSELCGDGAVRVVDGRARAVQACRSAAFVSTREQVAAAMSNAQQTARADTAVQIAGR